MPRTVFWIVLMVWGCAASAETPTEPSIRPAGVAGSWYPGDTSELRDYVDGLLAQAKVANPELTSARPRAIIAPHAGYRYSGLTAASAYRLLTGKHYERVIVIGPAHRAYFHGISIADVSHYQTPLGLLPLDTEAIETLRRSKLVSAHPSAHIQEHSIEMQLPLLQRTLTPGWKLLPLLVGDMSDSDYRQTADLLRAFSGDNTLIVVSSDFTHYGKRFSYLPFALDEHTAQRLEQLDKGSLPSILSKDPAAFLRYQRETGMTICGFRPIALLLHLLSAQAEGELLAYTTSGELTGDYANSVSYLSILFHDRPTVASTNGMSDGLSVADMQWLHELAQRSVNYAVHGQDEDAKHRLSQWLESTPAQTKPASGAFVTLKKQGALRGCIGYIRARKPLFQTVAENGINAALNDHRFPRLKAEELKDLDIEVSVLTPPRPIDSYVQYKVAEQGIILKKDGRSAVFLPEVATEQGWDRAETLTHLSRKAGLPADAWKSGAEFQVFQAQKISGPMSAVH